MTLTHKGLLVDIFSLKDYQNNSNFMSLQALILYNSIICVNGLGFFMP